MTTPTLTAEQRAEVVQKIRVLRAYTEQSGFRTTRSEKELLSRLSPDDLSAVLCELARENRSDAV
jgi:hypothetical protein